MKSFNKKKIIKYALYTFLIAIFLTVDIVYAGTTSKIHFCDYGGVRRTFKIVGIILNLVKTIVPLIIIFSAISSFFQIVLSGKNDDLKKAISKVFKSIIAGLVIFLLPTLIDYTFDTLAYNRDDSSFTACTNCLLDTEHCKMPDEDPDINAST